MAQTYKNNLKPVNQTGPSPQTHHLQPPSMALFIWTMSITYKICISSWLLPIGQGCRQEVTTHRRGTTLRCLALVHGTTVHCTFCYSFQSVATAMGCARCTISGRATSLVMCAAPLRCVQCPAVRVALLGCTLHCGGEPCTYVCTLYHCSACRIFMARVAPSSWHSAIVVHTAPLWCDCHNTTGACGALLIFAAKIYNNKKRHLIEKKIENNKINFDTNDRVLMGISQD